jgi:GST-like protein
MAGLGPMMGQANHFRSYAPEKLPYAIERYSNETLRLLNVMDKRLEDRPFIAGKDYSIADMAAYPWAMFGVKHFAAEHPLPNLQRWVDAIAERPATVRAYAIGERPEYQIGEATEEEKKRLFHQGAHSVKR